MAAEYQSAASDVLVAMGTQFCNEVMEDLLQKFQPGVLPHFFVVQTMANLATVNGMLNVLEFSKNNINFNENFGDLRP